MKFMIQRMIVAMLLLQIVFAGGKVSLPSEKEEIRDTIVVHGMVLHGKVVDLGPERLSFRLNYATGVNHIKYEDIDSIYTKYNYHISYKRIDIEGRVVAIEDGKYLKIVDSEGHDRTIKIADIDNFVISVQDDDSMENRIRNKFPYTKGSFNIGFEKENGNSKKDKIDVLINGRYKKAESEIKFYFDYAYETTETENSPKVQNKDELSTFLTYKYHYTNNAFYYGTIAAEYDKPRHIDNQYVPSVGYGYRFKFGKQRWIEPSFGLGYATVNYTDESYDNKRFAVAAANLFWKYQIDEVPWVKTLITDGFILYYPSIEEFEKDWIMRGILNFTVPLFDFFSIKLAFDFINDSNPDPNVGNNKTTTKLLFGVDF
jgi:putative salt-induced outer membrane protein YdiY